MKRRFASTFQMACMEGDALYFSFRKSHWVSPTLFGSLHL